MRVSLRERYAASDLRRALDAYGTNVRNAGICHMGSRGAGSPAACGNQRAHMTFGSEQFGAMPTEQRCKRCEGKYDKWQAMKAKRESAGGDASYHYDDGAKAKKDGQPESANPYPAGSDARRLWQEGYNGVEKKDIRTKDAMYWVTLRHNVLPKSETYYVEADNDEGAVAAARARWQFGGKPIVVQTRKEVTRDLPLGQREREDEFLAKYPPRPKDVRRPLAREAIEVTYKDIDDGQTYKKKFDSSSEADQWLSAKGDSVKFLSRKLVLDRAYDASAKERLGRLTDLYHSLREEWKNLSGKAREEKAKEVSYVQRQMYDLSDQIKKSGDRAARDAFSVKARLGDDPSFWWKEFPARTEQEARALARAYYEGRGYEDVEVLETRPTGDGVAEVTDYRTERGFVARASYPGGAASTSPLFITPARAKEWLEKEIAAANRRGVSVIGTVRPETADPAYMHDAVARDVGEWIAVPQEEFDRISVGATYSKGGRTGKVVEKDMHKAPGKARFGTGQKQPLIKVEFSRVGDAAANEKKFKFVYAINGDKNNTLVAYWSAKNEEEARRKARRVGSGNDPLISIEEVRDARIGDDDPWQRPWVRAALRAGKPVPSWAVMSANTQEEFEELLGEPLRGVYARPGDAGVKIPPPADPKERAEWERKVAERARLGKSPFVGEDAGGITPEQVRAELIKSGEDPAEVDRMFAAFRARQRQQAQNRPNDAQKPSWSGGFPTGEEIGKYVIMKGSVGSGTGDRRRARDCDCAACRAKDDSSWVSVRQEMYERMQIGKSYKFSDGRIGRVVAKQETSGQTSAAGWAMGGPMVKVQWRATKDDDPKKTYYVSLAYVRGPNSVHGPYKGVTRAEAERRAKAEADRSRHVVSAQSEAQDHRTIDPPKSEAQRRAAWAAVNGKSTLGISPRAGKAILGAGER